MEALTDLTLPVRGEFDGVERLVHSAFSSAAEALGDLERRALRHGGKRIRPAVTLLAGAAAGPLGDGNVRLAAAAELIHTATLAHDDVIDGAALRRGRATLNASWGDHVAVLFGDYLLARAFEILCGVGDDEVLPAVVGMTRRVCEGEIRQTRRRFDISMTEGEYLEIVSMKTASLFSTCCALSAALAGASAAAAASAGRFGERFGVAFQIADDCLDVNGAETGKDRYKDIEAGNVTLPIIKALALLDGADREAFAVAFRGSDVRRCRAAILASGALAECATDAARIMDEALAELSALPDSAARRSLAEIASIVLRSTAP
ncbi:MAG: polyprenyl synthetase family protein [bacterium]|nr:polyprenyl synthetase family protein [bacterium]